MTEIFHGGWNHQSVVIDPIYSTVTPKKNQTDQMEKKNPKLSSEFSPIMVLCN